MESKEIGVFSLKYSDDGALVAMFIQKEGGWVVEEGSDEIGDKEELGGAMEPLVFGEALFDDHHAHGGGGGAFDGRDGYD